MVKQPFYISGKRIGEWTSLRMSDGSATVAALVTDGLAILDLIDRASKQRPGAFQPTDWVECAWWVGGELYGSPCIIGEVLCEGDGARVTFCGDRVARIPDKGFLAARAGANAQTPAHTP